MPFKCTYLQALQARKLDVPNLLLVRAYVSCCIVRDKKSLVPYVRLPFSVESTPCKESLPPFFSFSHCISQNGKAVNGSDYFVSIVDQGRKKFSGT